MFRVLQNSSFRQQMMAYGHALVVFLFWYHGSWRLLLLLFLAWFVCFAVYLCYHIRFLRKALDDIRFSQSDFSHKLKDLVIESPLHEKDEEIECVICMESFDQDTKKAYQLQCPCRNHFYHRSCITDWLLKTSTCPICRVDLKSKSLLFPF